MADTDGIPVIGGLFKIAKAPFKLIGSVGETGLGLLSADGRKIGSGLTNAWNSIWDVPEGAFDTVKDVASAGEIFSSDVHIRDNDNKQATKVAPKKQPPTKQVAVPPASSGHVSPKASKTVQKPVTPKVQVPQKPAAVPAAKGETTPPTDKTPVEKPEAQIVPPVVQKPAQPAPKADTAPSAPKANEAPKADVTPKEESTPKTEVTPSAPQTTTPAPKSSNTGEKILKYALITAGVIAGALLLKKSASSLFKLFSKNKVKDPMIKQPELYRALTGKEPVGQVAASVGTDPMIKQPELYEALKGKEFTPKFGTKVHPTPAPTQDVKLLEYKPEIKTPTVPTKPTVTPATPEKLPPLVTPEDIMAGKFSQKVPPQVTPEDILKQTKTQIQPKAVEKSGVVVADKYANLPNGQKPTLIRTISDDEAKVLAEKAHRKQYLKKVTAEVKAQAKARAAKAAEETAKKAAEETAKKAAEDAAKKGSQTISEMQARVNESFGKIHHMETRLAEINAQISALNAKASLSLEEETILRTLKKTKSTIKGQITKTKQAMAKSIVPASGKKRTAKVARKPQNHKQVKTSKETTDVNLTVETEEENVISIAKKLKRQQDVAATAKTSNISAQQLGNNEYYGGLNDIYAEAWQHLSKIS